MDNKIISVTDFIRRFGDYADLLPTIDKIILTRDGRPFATVKAAAETKNEKLLALSGIWKNTKLDSDSFWKEILVRKNRQVQIKI
jgi:hypothetical protein